MVKTSCPAWLRCCSWNLYQFKEWLFILVTKDNLSRPLLDGLEGEYTFIETT